MKRIPTVIREQVHQRANARCEYCQLPENYVNQRHQIDHIVARRHEGSDELKNLALACFYCNNGKGSDLSSIDPLTKQPAWLYNPRLHKWNDHFAINSKGLIQGKTPEARATIRLLDMNNPERIELRQILIEAGLW